MELEEQIKKDIEKYTKEIIKRCLEQNDETKKELERTLEFLREQAKQRKGDIDLSKIKPPKYPICYNCPFENKEELK